MSRMPMLRPDFVMRPDILFVGVNPSFSEKAATKFDEKHGYKGSVIAWNANSTEDDLKARVKLLVDAERTAQRDYRVYYAPFERFQHQVRKEGCRTEHLDVFLLRHTSQSDVKALLWKTPSFKRGTTRAQRTLTSFGADLFDVFLDTLHGLKPRTVLVANASAAGLVKELLSLETKDDRIYRTFRAPHIAFFLSGMLGGRGPMDNYSKARLAADIRDELGRLDNAAASAG